MLSVGQQSWILVAYQVILAKKNTTFGEGSNLLVLVKRKGYPHFIYLCI